MTNTDSPFIIRSTSASSNYQPQHPPAHTTANIIKSSSNDKQKVNGLGASFGTVLGESKIEGTLYWNHDAVSSSLVCGSSSKEVLRTVMQMIRLHLNDARNSSALIFHANTRDHILPPSQVTTVQISKRLSSPTIFLAPRPRQNIKERYTDIPIPPSDVLPLRIAERDISLAHVLALCTPPEDYPGREAILVKVQGLIGRLAEPFSIQEFNQFVDEEQWDENASSFMALRQTLLTTLTLVDGEGDIGLASKANIDITSRMKRDASIIVDLSDPVLRSTGMDATLFDMILCLYCMIKPDSKKLLVLDQAPEYLTPSSTLLNTLITLLSMHADSPLRTLVSSSDVGQLSSRLLNHLDSFILHECRSPAWLSHIQHHVSCPIPSQSIYGLESRQALVISPRSVSHVHGNDHHGHTGTKWGTQTQRVEIGWEWPLSIEQQKIEQLQALVAQLSHNSAHLLHHPNPHNTHSLSAAGGVSSVRRSRKESTYVETTMNALRSALGYLATRRTTDLSNDASLEGSPAAAPVVPAPASAITGTVAGTGSGTHTRTPTMTGTVVNEGAGNEAEERKEFASPIIEESSGQESDRKKSSGLESVWPKSSAQDSEWVKSSEQESVWMKKPVTPEPKFTAPPRIRDLQDLGPFTASEPNTKPLILPRRQSLARPSSAGGPYDKTKLAAAILQAISNAGGALGMPVSNERVGEAFRRSAPPDVFRVPPPPIDAYRVSEPQYNRESWRMSMPHVPGAWRSSMPPEAFGHDAGFGKAANEMGFSTWKEITQFAEKEGIVKVVSNGQEEWIVMPKPPSPKTVLVTEDLGEVDSGVPVQSPDGWYDRKGTEPFPTMLEKALIRNTINTSVYEPLIQTITSLQAKQTIVQAPLLLVSVSYEIKRRFPTAIKDAGFKTILEYIHGAQARGLVEISDDSGGSIYVQLAEPVLAEVNNAAPAVPNPPVSEISVSTEKSQPESSAMPSSEVHLPFSRDKFEPLIAVLRSLKRHDLYKVTLIPLSLAIEKMFPNAMTRSGVGNMEEYVTQARDAGLVMTGNTVNGNLWVSLAENMDTYGSMTPTQNKGRANSMVAASDFPLPPTTPRPPNFSRLLRAIRALSSQGPNQKNERVLCSRVGMMLNKDDYKAMNVETFNQALVAASKANLVVHGGVTGTAWVALKNPDVAGVTNSKLKGKVMEEGRARLQKSSPPEIAINPVVPSGSAYKLPLSEADVEPFKPLLTVLKTFIHGKHIAEPFRSVVEKNLLRSCPGILADSGCYSMDEYVLRAQSYGLVAQVGHGKAARLRLLENSGLVG